MTAQKAPDPAYAGNPLISPPSLPYGAPAFDLIEPEHFAPAIDWAIAKAKAAITAIKNNPAPADFENTIEALEFADEELSRVISTISVIASSNGSDQVNLAMKAIRPKLVDYSSEVSFDKALLQRIKEVDQNATIRAKLNPVEERLLDQTVGGFGESGINLPANKQKRLKEINGELARLSEKFGVNVTKATAEATILVDQEKDLSGLPKRLKDSFAKAATNNGEAGKWLIQNNANASFVYTHCENRDLREKLSTEFGKVACEGAYDNRPVILQIVKLRHEKAKLLGYKNYAEKVLSGRMAGDAKTVMDFLNKNLATYTPAAKKDYNQIKDFAEKTYGLTDYNATWDSAYYERLLKEKLFDVNLEEIQEYFELENVLKGLTQHAEKLFNVEMAEVSGRYPVYHPDVKVYEVKDKATGSVSGLFYADYFERPGSKRGGAWASSVRKRGLFNGQDSIPIILNNANIAKADVGPTLLTMRQVQTIFHEFGHAMHNLLAEGRYPSMSGTSVSWDFVELPSQLQENWIRKKEVLDSFAKHYQTKQPLSDELIDKISQMESFGAGSSGKGQTFLALLDMAWHTTNPQKIKSVEALENKVRKQFGYAAGTGSPRSPRFSHLFAGGYAAGYYSYKWAEVLEADVFETLFEKKGLYDPDSAKRLKETIYAMGGNYPAMDIFKKLMGREPDPNALFRREGLAPANDNQQDPPAAPKSKPDQKPPQLGL